MRTSEYRPDVDGLRAIAVVSVLAFHAWPGSVKSGFIGVDIFFVISGYLISNIIFNKAEAGKFSYKDFYIGRIKRIFPSLILVLAASAFIGWYVLFAVEYRQLGMQIAAASTFTSNVLLWLDTGYFDSGASLKPLLHLWSLGVEEQYYIIWPIIALLAFRSRGFLIVTSVLGALSLLSCLFLSYSKYQSLAFYMPFTRFWELASGGLLAFFTLHTRPLNRAATEWLSISGAACYLAALILTRGDKIFPGYLAILPVLAGTLVILAGPKAFINRKLLAHPAMVNIGLVSYPLYLWHWPLLVYFRILLGGSLPPEAGAIASGLAVILAILSYQLVEKRVRTSAHSAALAASLCLVMVGIAIGGLSIQLSGGLVSRAINTLNPSDRAVGRVSGDLEACRALDPAIRSIAYCVAQRGQPPTYAMLGDSKAAALFPGVLEETANNGSRWMLIGGHSASGSPLPVISDAPEYSGAQSMTLAAINLIAHTDSVKAVVLVMATRELFKTDDRFLKNLNSAIDPQVAYDGLDRTIERFVSVGKSVVIVEDNPALEESSICLPRETASRQINRLFEHSPNERCSVTETQIATDTLLYHRILSRLSDKWGSALAIFSPLNSLCDNDSQICNSVKDGHALYSYGDHLSAYGARLEAVDLIEFLGALPSRGPALSSVAKRHSLT